MKSVRTLITECCQRVNLCAGDNVPAAIFKRALALLNDTVMYYSGNSLLTAFQGYCDAVGVGETFTIGACTVSSGKTLRYVHLVGDAPTATAYDIERNYLYEMSSGNFFRAATIDNHYVWMTTSGRNCCSFVPDVVVPDVSDIVHVAYSDGQFFRKLPCAQFSEFLFETRPRFYTASAIGEKKFQVQTKGVPGKQLKIVYCKSMSLGENDSIDLPEKYTVLLGECLCYRLCLAYPAIDNGNAAEYKLNAEKFESDIMASNSGERMVLRNDFEFSASPFAVDIWRL